MWLRFADGETLEAASGRLTAFGLGMVERRDLRLQVSGWNTRLLRRRLGIALAGVDDLKVEWDATAELARYHYDRHAVAGVLPEPEDVLADVEQALRQAVPIPHRAPAVDDVDSLLQLVEAAEDAYRQLVAEHVEHAAAVLAEHARSRTPNGR